MSRRILSAVALGAVLCLLSCTQSALPTSPPVASLIEAGSLATTARGHDLLAGFRIEIDPETLTATVTPHRTASAQPPQGQRYDLDIANFQNADSFRVTGVQVLGSGNFRITFSHAHPFPAPNIANPATGTNRADLGYTGRLVILTSYNPKSFFTNAVRMSAGAVVSPDGYVEVGDLLANAGPSLVSAYPYKLLADESLDNRVGISNEGIPSGTYATSAGGWQRVNLGSEGTGWTGYDYLHGGQSISNTFVLDKDALAATNFSIDVALLIQYTDPRGAGGSTFRLPPSIINATDFAYRLPHAALDCSKTSFTQNLALSSASGAAATLEVRVRDWDAAAAEAGDATVGDEGEDVDLVTAGASGAPEVVLDAPGILVGLRNMGTGTGTGVSNDPLFYSNDVVNQEEAGPGEYFACLRITDPEFDDPQRDSFHAGVDATTLLPDAARAVPARTWQIVPITVTQALQPPEITRVDPVGIVGAADEYVTFSASWEGQADNFTWDFSGGIRNGASSIYKISTQLAGIPATYNATVTASNSAGDSEPFTFSFRILSPERPRFNASFVAEADLFLSSVDDSLMTIHEGKPILFYTLGNGLPTVGDLWVAQAISPFPSGPGEWLIYRVAEQTLGPVSVATINGRLAVAYPSATDDQIGRYSYPLVDTPTQESDWLETDFRLPAAGQDWGRLVALTNYAERPAMLVRENSGMTTHYFRGLTATPTSPADWQSHQISTTIEIFDIAVGAFLEGERPVLVLGDRNPANVGIRSSVVAEPDALADWSGGSRNLSQDLINLAAIAVPAQDTSVMHVAVTTNAGELNYLGFTGPDAGSLDDFQYYLIPQAEAAAFGNASVSITILNDRLAIGYVDLASNRYALARAMWNEPQRSDWELAALPGESAGLRGSIMPYANTLAVFTDPDDWTFFVGTGPW